MALVGLVFIGIAVSFVLSGAGLWSVWRSLRRPVPSSSVFPPVSVLKPLKGFEAGLYENLQSIARQDYPDFEILFGIDDPDDPAVEVALRVKRENPERRIRICTGAAWTGFNPKVNNLLNLLRFARHDLFLISDSNVRVGHDYLRALTAELADPAVGLVHSVLLGRGSDTLGSLLENVQMNTVTAYGVCGMPSLSGLPLVVGKSMLMRRSDLETIGGLLGVANVLAEDYVLGRRFHDAGFRVKLSPYRVGVMNAGWSLSRFLNRQMRWSQMRRHLAPGAYFFEPMMNTLLWASLLPVAAFAANLSPKARLTLSLLAPVAVAARALLDSVQVSLLRGRGLTPRELLALPVKDVLMFGMWVMGYLKRSVDWRGTVVRIGPGSILAPRRPGAQHARA